MSRFTQACLVATAFLVLTVQCVYCEEKPNPDDLAIDILSSEGLKLQVPFVPDIIESWPEEKCKYYLDSIEPLMEYSINTGDEILESKANAFRWIKIGAKLVVLVTKAATRQSPPALRVKDSVEFCRDSVGMIRDILDRSDEIEKSMQDSREPKCDSKLRRQFHAYFQTILEGMRASKVVCFVDWRRGTIDGVPFPEYSSMIFGSLKYHGYSALSNIMRKLLDIAMKLL